MRNGRTNGAAAFYDDYWRRASPPPASDPTTLLRWRKLLRTLERFPRGGRVLDYGCGDGLFAARLISKGFQVTGVDVSEKALDLARANVPEARFFNVQEEGSWLVRDNYGACWCSEVLEHLFSPSDALRKIAFALEPRATLLGTVPFHGLLKNLAIALLRFERHFDTEGGHIRFFTRRSLGKLLLKSGFTPVRSGGIGRIWPFWKSLFFEARKVPE